MIRFIWAFFSIWRLNLFLIAGIASFILPFIPRYPYWEGLLLPSGFPGWVWSWAGFDGVHYLTIAKSGYSAQFTQAFFPLYPLLIKLLTPIFGGNFILSGLAISNGLFLLSLFLFYKLMFLDFKENLEWMIIFMLVFPTSFFFGSLYSESLFLSLTLAAFLSSRKEKWMLAGIFGALASLTRPVGVFLFPALLWEWYQRNRLKNENNNLKLKIQVKNYQCLWLFLIPLGLIIYMAYLGKYFFDPLYFLHAQPAFGAQRTGGEIILLPQVVWRYFKIFVTVPIFQYNFWIAAFEFVTFWLVFVLLIIAQKKKIRASYLIFSWLIFLTPTLTGTFSSLPRYVLPIFPIFMILGSLKSRRLKAGLILVSATLLLILAALFTRGRWVA